MALCTGAKLFPWTLSVATIIPAFPVKRIPYRGIPQKFIDSQIASPAGKWWRERLRRSLIKFAEELSLFQNEITYGFPQLNFLFHYDASDLPCEISIKFAKHYPNYSYMYYI